jgi:hypothetical protein
VDVEFVTTTRSSGPIVCAQYIIPWYRTIYILLKNY